MTELSLHDFHCVLDRNMKEKLRDLNIFKAVRGVSGNVVRILAERLYATIVYDSPTFTWQKQTDYRIRS